MSSSANKTVATKSSIDDFLAGVSEPKRRDSYKLIAMMERISGEKPVIWGSRIVGFGSYHYKYKSGREGDMGMLSFSPRKANMTIYIVDGFDRYADLLAQLGKHDTSVSCLYIKRLNDIDEAVLEEMLLQSYDEIKKWKER